jgi:hypothetical protein
MKIHETDIWEELIYLDICFKINILGIHNEFR